MRQDASNPHERQFLERYGMAEWIVENAKDGFCWFDRKCIQRIPGDYALFLHEAAHALAHEQGFSGEGFHGGLWADRFTDLVREEFGILAAEVKMRWTKLQL